MEGLQTIMYATSSSFKVEECKLIVAHCLLADRTPVNRSFQFEFQTVAITETLEVDIEQMVRAEAKEAYSTLRVPCIVEHAGLIFEKYKDRGYPGGLTKPMWNTLDEKFVGETASANQPAIARAVVAYCDGMKTHTFIGETPGKIAAEPRGSRKFYWDTVFIPDDPNGKSGARTYAEINDDPSLGLQYKVTELSQSTRAMMKFLNFLKDNPSAALWRQ